MSVGELLYMFYYTLTYVDTAYHDSKSWNEKDNMPPITKKQGYFRAWHNLLVSYSNFFNKASPKKGFYVDGRTNGDGLLHSCLKKPVVSRKLVFISRRSGKIWNKLLPEQFLVYLTLTDWSWPFPDFQMLPSITAFLKGKLNVTFQRSSRVLYILKQTYLVHI